MKTYPLVAIAVALLCGCAGVKTRTTYDAGTAARTHTAYVGRVCLLAGALPDGTAYADVGRISATKGTYGERENLMAPIAVEARRIGADVVMNLQADIKFKGPLPWRVSAPTGSGIAVRIATSSLPFDCQANGGTSY